MTDRWAIREVARGDHCDFLLVGPGSARLPSVFSAELEHSTGSLRLGLSCKFRGIGTRIEVEQVVVTADHGRPIAPRDLSAIELARAVFLAASAAVVDPGDVLYTSARPGRRPTPEELQLVAELYSWHFVAWGSPRRAVSDVWGIPRSTANRWLRAARELFPDLDSVRALEVPA